jgi:hypothetical protein
MSDSPGVKVMVIRAGSLPALSLKPLGAVKSVRSTSSHAVHAVARFSD